MNNCNKNDGCRWRRRKEARPGEILDAALELFTERGFAATKLEDVARAAGISKGTLYLYYDGKEALFRDMVQEVLLPVVEQAEQTAQDFEGPTPELIRKMAHHWWQTVGESRLSAIPKLMISEAGNFPELAQFYVEKLIQRIHGLLGRVLQRGIDRGEFRQCDVKLAVRALSAPLVFAAIWKHSLAPYDEPFDVPDFLDVQLDLMLHGLNKQA